MKRGIYLRIIMSFSSFASWWLILKMMISVNTIISAQSLGFATVSPQVNDKTKGRDPLATW